MVATEDSLALSYKTAGTVTLTGDDLSIEDVVRKARRGARVGVSREVEHATTPTPTAGVQWR